MIPEFVINAALEAFLKESIARKGELGANSLALLAALEAVSENLPANKAIEDVLAIHRKVQNRDEDGDTVPGSHCEECKDVDDGELVYEIYPCLTVREITAALEGRQTHTDMRRQIEGMVK